MQLKFYDTLHRELNPTALVTKPQLEETRYEITENESLHNIGLMNQGARAYRGRWYIENKMLKVRSTESFSGTINEVLNFQLVTLTTSRKTYTNFIYE